MGRTISDESKWSSVLLGFRRHRTALNICRELHWRASFVRRSCCISLYYNASSRLQHVQENLFSFKFTSTTLKPDLIPKSIKILSKACCQQYIGASTTLTSEARDPHVQSCNWNPSGKSLGQRICLSYNSKNPSKLSKTILFEALDQIKNQAT